MPTPFTKEELEKQVLAKETADSISSYLNEMEKICTVPMSDQDKVEAFNQFALYTGKALVAFSNFCRLLDIYAERGARGGKKRKAMPSFSDKSDDDKFEYVEEP